MCCHNEVIMFAQCNSQKKRDIFLIKLYLKTLQPKPDPKAEKTDVALYSVHPIFLICFCDFLNNKCINKVLINKRIAGLSVVPFGLKSLN